MLVPLLVTASPAYGQAVDVVELQNGTRVIGEVKSMRRARLQVGTDDMGTIEIEWTKVRSVTAPEFFEVEDVTGRLHFGALRPGPAAGQLEVAIPAVTRTLALRDVTRIQRVKAGFLERLSGAVDLGLSYAASNRLLQFNGDAEVRYRKPGFETTASADAVISRQPGAEETRRSSGTFAYNAFLSNRQRLFARTTLEQNRELGFTLRASVMGGWGKFLALSSSHELLGGVGLAVNREVPVAGARTTNLEAVMGVDYGAFAYDFPNTDINLGAMTYVGLTHWGRVRVESSARLRRELLADFFVGIKLYESYDSDPATQDGNHHDWGLALSLGYKF